MSIIEKAANRIEQGAAASKPQVSGAATRPVADDLPLAVEALAAAPAAPTPEPGASVEAPAAPRRSAPQQVHLDLERMRNMGMVTAAAGRTPVVEEFRIIKRPLLKDAFLPREPNGKPNNLIMVTSSLAGEGKTFCAINLAMSIAMELDHTVLLVDADVARPSVLRTLGLPAQRGLMDVLLNDNLDVGDVLLRTNVDTLSILAAGASNPRATELLASQSMRNLVYEIANRYPDRVVIFDSPPILLTSEARVLASHMAQIVMVVEAETTTQHAVKDALHQLEGCRNVNLIYNKMRAFPGETTYDYNYG
ncbi:protein tyrosine kinase [Massilia sp. KIM]|uniref:XrtA-associated tyrosine autokinase n=1 Tax=Massilia sp. KIM TaxID=1955422 RepID=UPI00098FE118|nr:XrtA-associated tyrosine autokinase [Massilia sp. KIM]OON59519.1 protein tyrosine kinase [Massilia sp. KIM]